MRMMLIWPTELRAKSERSEGTVEIDSTGPR